MKPFPSIKTLKAMASGLLAVGSTLTIAACYGPMEPIPDHRPRGLVMDRSSGIGIAGLEVCATQGNYRGCAITDAEGYYLIESDNALHRSDYQLCVRDIDGPANGLYDESCRTIEAYSNTTEFNFVLEEVEE